MAGQQDEPLLVMVRHSGAPDSGTQPDHLRGVAVCHRLLCSDAHLRLHLQVEHSELLFLFCGFLQLRLLHARCH